MKTSTLQSLTTTDPADKLLSLETELSDGKASVADSRKRIVAARSELADLLAARTALDTARAPLKQQHADASAKVEECKQSLARHRGRSTESLYTERLQEAGQAVAIATAKLADYDSQSGITANEARSTELQALIAKEEQALVKTEAKLKDLQSTYDAAHAVLGQSVYQALKRRLAALETHLKAESETIAELRNDFSTELSSISQQLNRWPQLADSLRQEYGRVNATGLADVLQSYLDLLDTIEVHGPALGRMRLDDAIQWNVVLGELMIHLDDIADWFAAPGDQRLGLKDRQATVKAHLKKLQA